MIHTTASFRALRETVGYSLADLCQALDVSDRTARRWESPRGSVPEWAWEQLVAERAAQLEQARAIADVLALAAPGSVELPYYLNQEHYGATRGNAPFDIRTDSYHVANATMREVAARLEDMGFEPQFSY